MKYVVTIITSECPPQSVGRVLANGALFKPIQALEDVQFGKHRHKASCILLYKTTPS